MGRAGGGSKLEGELDQLRIDLFEYHGQLADWRDGLSKDLPLPPEALVLWRQCRATGMPLAAGGLMDQPHIWLMELAVVLDFETIIERIKDANNGENKPEHNA